MLITGRYEDGARIEYANDAFCAMTGYAPEEVIGRNCRFLQGEDRQQDCIARIRETLNRHEAGKFLLRNYRKGGELFWNELSLAPIHDDNRRARGFVGVQRDVTELIEKEEALKRHGEELERANADLEDKVLQRTRELTEANHRLKQMAMHDQLTGALNRHTLKSIEETEIRQHRRDGTMMGAMLIDLDHFKETNDRHGHAAGDAVLTALAHSLKRAFRPRDSIIRFGGEEFLVLLPNISYGQLEEISERILRLIRSTPTAYNGGTIGTTASIGYSTWRPEEPDLTAAIERADAALYEAKRSGRDRSCGLAADQAPA